MTIRHDQSFRQGKYLVSPLTRLTECGDFAASLSIRSGSGKNTLDRVFRFIPRFPTRSGALGYAVEQGLIWLRDPAAA
jgi:hypothetical protein